MGFLVLAVLVGNSLLAAAHGVSPQGERQRPAARKKMSVALPEVIDALIRKWAATRKLPVNWVRNAVWRESRGRADVPTRYVDAAKAKQLGQRQEFSVGLMQVNVLAQRSTLASVFNITGTDAQIEAALRDPDTNIAVGTYLMRQAYDSVLKALAGKKPPAPLDVLVRAYYVNPALTIEAIKAGRDPRKGTGGLAKATVAWESSMAEINRAYA